MTSSITETLTHALPSLSLSGATTPPAAPTADATPAAKPKPKQWQPLDPELGFDDPSYKYKQFLPNWEETDYKLPPTEPFEHVDPGLAAKDDADYLAFLKGGEVEELTPDFGSEVKGVQLSELDAQGRQRLARFVAERGVVAFRGQDLIDKSPEWQVDDWTAFYGKGHVHPTSPQPAGLPGLHLVYRDGKHAFDLDTSERFSNSGSWHSDVSYELQPPGLTALFLYDAPSSGGDTGFADQRGAYRQLSPSFRAYLETLQVVHSAHEQAERGRVLRRAPVKNVHPLVRRHPVTGEKALYVNRGFSRSIVGLKKEESDAILDLLYAHIAQGADFQVRVRWREGTVVLWDNRITAHTATFDYTKQGDRRHGARLTPQAERPFL